MSEWVWQQMELCDEDNPLRCGAVVGAYVSLPLITELFTVLATLCLVTIYFGFGLWINWLLRKDCCRCSPKCVHRVGERVPAWFVVLGAFPCAVYGVGWVAFNARRCCRCRGIDVAWETCPTCRAKLCSKCQAEHGWGVEHKMEMCDLMR